jgi:GNAT superfamily N-acetyltransferase
MRITVRPLTPDLWPALEDLFGKGGASNGCWCMYWRLGPEYHKRPREKNRIALRSIVEHGPPPGLLAFDGEKPVGWCQLTPRADLDWLNSKAVFAPADAQPVWSISCFYVRRGYRGRGVMSALVAAAIDSAKRADAPAIEAYPVDTARPGCTRNVFTGTVSAFRRLGFRTVARRDPSRPIMRYHVKGITG